MTGICREHSKNVRRWQDGTMALRWCAAGMPGAGHQFRRVNGHLHLPRLRAALEAHFRNAGAAPEPERYAGHKRDGRPDQVMSLMHAPNHEMHRVRCAGHVDNPGDDRQDSQNRQEDGQRPPAGGTA
jgi:hypothetical protein